MRLLVPLRGTSPLVSVERSGGNVTSLYFKAFLAQELVEGGSCAKPNAAPLSRSLRGASVSRARHGIRGVSVRWPETPTSTSSCLSGRHLLPFRRQESSPETFGSQQSPVFWRRCQRFFTSGGWEQKDLYRVLGVSPGDGPRAIRAAYLRKAKELHPDANPHCPRRQQKEKLFRQVTEAYEVLANPEKRREYDSTRPSEEPAEAPKRHSVDDWHIGRDEIGEEFWRQVDQIRREKERAWRTMKVCSHVKCIRCFALNYIR